MSEYYKVGPYEISTAPPGVRRGGEPLEFSDREATLLLLLAKCYPEAELNTALISSLWPDDVKDPLYLKGSLKELIHRVNRKLGQNGAGGKYIRSRNSRCQFSVVVKRGLPAQHEARKIIVGCFPYPPLMDWDTPRNKYVGPWVRLIEELSRRMDIDIDIQLVSASNFSDSKSIKADVVLGLFWTEKRAEVFDFSEPMYYIGLRGLCKALVPRITADRLKQGDLKILVQEGEVGWEYAKREFRRAYDRGNVIQAHGIATFAVVKDILSSKFDVVIADEVSCMHVLREKGKGHPVELAFEGTLDNYHCCLAAKKSLGWDMEAVSRHLIEIRNTETFIEYEANYLHDFEHVIRTANRY